MEWMYAFLRFDNQAVWESLAIEQSEDLAVDIIGPINDAGYHINVAFKGELAAILAPYSIEVAEPKRVFASIMLEKPEPIVEPTDVPETDVLG
jgi:hypothetical protein